MKNIWSIRSSLQQDYLPWTSPQSIETYLLRASRVPLGNWDPFRKINPEWALKVISLSSIHHPTGIKSPHSNSNIWPSILKQCTSILTWWLRTRTMRVPLIISNRFHPLATMWPKLSKIARISTLVKNLCWEYYIRKKMRNLNSKGVNSRLKWNYLNILHRRKQKADFSIGLYKI